MTQNKCGTDAYFKIVFVLLLGMSSFAIAKGKNWVLLVSGGQGYSNYGLQADVCHAYQVFSANGVPDDQIVVMMFDDIAYNELNPYPGEVINHPEGPNVYPGVPHDYVGYDVNTEVFLAVLLGDSEKVYKLTGYHGKVIDSGPEDHVFVFFTAHGAPGYMLMPGGSGIYATEMNDALQTMHQQKKFAKLVFYLETCYAGSFFDDLLPKDINVYAATSADPTEYAYFCYKDEDRDAYVGTYFICSWLENCDEVDIKNETLQEQFEIMVEGTPKSHPQQYGDLSLTALPVSDFIGEDYKFPRLEPQAINKDVGSFVSPDEVEIAILKQLLSDPRHESRHEDLRAELEEKLWLQAQTDVFIFSLASAALPSKDVDWVLNTPPTIKQRAAYEYAVGHLMNVCPRLGPSVNKFILRKMSVLVNMSNILSLKQVLAAIDMAASYSSPLC